MSLSKPRRPRIPSVFMPPDWSPGTSPNSSSPLAPATEIPDTQPPPLPTDPKSPTSSVRSTVAPPSDVFATTASPPPTLQEERAPTRSLRTNLRDLKQRQAAIRRAKAALDPQATPATGQTFLVPTSPPSSHSSSAPPTEIFTAPPTPLTRSPQASLRSVQDTLRRLKARQAELRAQHEQQRLDAEEISRLLSARHEADMLRICKTEASVYEGRWENTWKRAQTGSSVMLRFAQVPWPLLTPIVYSPEEISTRGVERFLLSPFRKPHMSSREKLQAELSKWESEAFEVNVIVTVGEEHKEDVRAGRQRVWGALQELLARLE